MHLGVSLDARHVDSNEAAARVLADLYAFKSMVDERVEGSSCLIYDCESQSSQHLCHRARIARINILADDGTTISAFLNYCSSELTSSTTEPKRIFCHS